jgi:hypothetical protein
VSVAGSAKAAGYLKVVDYLQVADYLKVAVSGDSCDGYRWSSLVRGLSAVPAASADPAVWRASSRQDVGSAGLVVLSVRVEFDRWVVSLDRANFARGTCSVQRPKRSPSLLPGGFPRPVHKS